MGGHRDERGFTLIEMLIVVAIVGILAGLASFMFSRQTGKAKSAEVRAVFAELATRQEQLRLRTGTYMCATATVGTCVENDFFPDAAPTKDARAYATAGTDWGTLRVDLDKTGLVCVYSVVAGPAGDGTNVGAIATADFGFTAADVPATTAWYYLLAECNLDGDATVNSRYFSRSNVNGIAIVNEGR